MTIRTLHTVHRGDGFHWVGDGFYVTQLLPASPELQRLTDPFLLMDYNPVKEYPPTTTPRGVGVHPHRGFETVTMAFEGAVAHHDSTGAGGVIRPGDVQWMTAASGILHKEYHEPEWAARGGRFHMMQLWVNLPAAHKMDAPGYQPLTAESMGKVKLDDGGVVTLVAGELDDVRGPARTVTPISLWDVQLGADESADLAVPDGHTLMTFVLDGELTTSTGTIGREEMGIFNREGDRLQVTAGEVGARFLVLGGKPIDEPVVFYGPFVMNTMEEIREAMVDFNNGKFGTLV
ncbi:MAG TPA: pirin family protein [Dermatophilaceae bacterium]|jgi:redox-sensitive bicupin YhaK (pirin superfamily)|nr:pirin family protein [Dermatophilaceae bacterium]HOF35890.1 pirin family protein [Dermatophilaceae bacterium]HOR14577.1 pirin family protein [Dermatophilaceae bacterium]HOV01377.1 pirin family protein [Dermatophilaceae bacterium]HPK89447.1 pirin family protein [Dermatophilaceae bacterium]